MKGAFAAVLAATVLAVPACAQEVSKPPQPFTEDFLTSEQNIAAGEEVWAEQCRHCHGRAAYPGKAPKLKPYEYEPEFVYRRVTDGFRKMPSWKEVYSELERMQITAYVLSDDFSP
jgi:mono/diheme cytochrome c family protein